MKFRKSFILTNSMEEMLQKPIIGEIGRVAESFITNSEIAQACGSSSKSRKFRVKDEEHFQLQLTFCLVFFSGGVEREFLCSANLLFIVAYHQPLSLHLLLTLVKSVKSFLVIIIIFISVFLAVNHSV